jgi:hypothetical protein
LTRLQKAKGVQDTPDFAFAYRSCPERTRLVAQIVAAVIGAAFVIGLQLAAIASNGTLSRYAVLASSRSSP